MGNFNEFFAYKKIDKCFNTSFLVLASKIVGAMNVKDFYHINHKNRIYKIICKVFANCLSTIMEKMIMKLQNTFVTKR